MLEHKDSKIKQTVFCIKMFPGYGEERHTIQICTGYRGSTEEGGSKSVGQHRLLEEVMRYLGFKGVCKGSLDMCPMWGKGHFRKREQYIQLCIMK